MGKERSEPLKVQPMRKKAGSSPQENKQEQASSRRVQKKDLRWDKLDNTAHLFPVIAGEEMSNVYRISVTLTELVEPDILQQALDIVLPKFELFDVRLRRGFFWHYFEENGKSAPRVQEENQFPCRYIHQSANNSYLFRVTYYKYRINLEVFHVLTDGMGGVNFLRELTYQYLRLRHPELMCRTEDCLSSGTTLNMEDSFLKNYRAIEKKPYSTQKAFIIKGEKLREGEFGVMHGYIRLSELKKLCRRLEVSINDYLVSAMVWSIYTECMNSAPSDKSIRIAVPVNLRPYYNSNTTKNFFAIVHAEFCPVKEKYSFEEVLAEVSADLSSKLSQDNLEKIISYNVSNQVSAFARLMPLPLKNLAMRVIYRRSGHSNTSTLSNMGKVEVAEIYRPYIELFHGYMAVSLGQPIKGTVFTYGDTLVFSFSYVLKDPGVQRGFFRRLRADGLELEIESNGVNYG